MSFSVEQFRSDFPEFSAPEGEQPESWPFADATVTQWATIAASMLNSDRFGTLIDLATELFVAHHIALEALDQKAVDVGQIPGLSAGAISASSAGDVSVSYDVNSVIEKDAGHWNLTRYGTRLKRMMSLFGAGPLQVGPCGGGPGGGWPGPPAGTTGWNW